MNTKNTESLNLPEAPEPITKEMLARQIQQAETILKQAEAMPVSTEQEYQTAIKFVKMVKVSLKSLEEMRKRFKKPYDEGAKTIQGIFSPPLGKLEKAEKDIKAKIKKFDDAKEAEARRIAEEEARKYEAEQKRLAEEAKKADAEGDSITAFKLREEIRHAAPPAVTGSVESSADGVSKRGTWKAVVMDRDAFIKAALADESLHNLFDPNISALNKYAQLTEGTRHIEGIKFYKDTTIAVRTT